MEYRDGVNAPPGPGPDARVEWGMQRHLEWRQGELETLIKSLSTQINGKEGIEKQIMVLTILTDQRHRATLCIGKWIAGVLAVLFAGLCYWVITETWQTRDAVKHLLSRPPTQQGVQGK